MINECQYNLCLTFFTPGLFLRIKDLLWRVILVTKIKVYFVTFTGDL